MTSLTEGKVLEEFKEIVKQYVKEDNFLHKDHNLLKWLKARDFNVKKAEKMFLNNVEFRKKFNVDNIKEEFVPNDILKTYVTGGLIGYDKEGNVLRVELFGKLDMKGLMYSCKASDLKRMKILECEQVVQMWKDRNNEMYNDEPSDGMTVIFDLEGVTSSVLWRTGLTMYLDLIQLLEDNYPEMLKRLLVLNAPSIFPFIWRICRPLISEHTKGKIHILNDNYKEELLKYVDGNVLPKCYGGQRTDEDNNPLCRNIISQGGLIPCELYNNNMINVNNAETLTISHNSEYVIKVEVTKVHSILRWEFKTVSYDICFGLLFKNRDYEEVFVIPLSRVHSHLVPEDGTFDCKDIGTYSLVFDNSFSYTRSKIIDIFYELLDPDSSFEKEVITT